MDSLLVWLSFTTLDKTRYTPNTLPIYTHTHSQNKLFVQQLGCVQVWPYVVLILLLRERCMIVM